MAELQYRPNHYDDWGMIRNADGSMHASVHRPETYGGEFDECREEGTDPFADLARKIIFYDDLEAENASLRQLLSEAEKREREAKRIAVNAETYGYGHGLEAAAQLAKKMQDDALTDSAREHAGHFEESIRALHSEER